MANRLKPVKIEAIRLLRQRGWSSRRIARELGVNRETVNRYVRRMLADAANTDPPSSCDSNPAISHTGSSSDTHPKPAHSPMNPASGLVPSIQTASNPAISHTGSDPTLLAKPAISHTGIRGRTSLCTAYQEVIQDKLEQGLSIQRIYQDLRSEHGFPGSYHSVQRFLQKLHPRVELPFRRIEVAPGEEVQVDFGQGAWIIGAEGKKSRPHLFRMVLSHSRKAYSEVVPRQTTDAFLQCLENAFHHYGGVTKTVVIDNLKAGVLQADWYDPELNPQLEAFARHYGTVFLPTRPRTPRHKGKVERGVGYAQGNALKAMTFASLHEQNVYLRHWEATVADTRIHGTTRRQVRQHFQTLERAALLPLPEQRFPHYQEGQRQAGWH